MSFCHHYLAQYGIVLLYMAQYGIVFPDYANIVSGLTKKSSNLSVLLFNYSIYFLAAA